MKRRTNMKKILTLLLCCVLMLCGAIGLTACGGEKNITVVAREQGSGTREAFDKVVTDGNGNFLEMKIEKTGKFRLVLPSKRTVFR